MKQVFYILIFFALAACGPQHHLKRAKYHVEKAKQLGAKVTLGDTVYVPREVIVPEHTVDTLYLAMNFTDTLFMETERIKVKVKLDTLLREVFVEAKCKPDTITVQVPVQVKPATIKAGYSLWDLLGLIIIALLVGIFINPVVVKLFK